MHNHSQDRSEYLFDDEGGQGTPASTFFKRLAHSNSKLMSSEAPSVDQRVIGASYSHADNMKFDQRYIKLKGFAHRQDKPSTRADKTKLKSDKPYLDVDDDWDDNIERNLVRSQRIQKSIEHVPEREALQRSYSGSNPGIYRSTSNSAGDRDLKGVKNQYSRIIKDPISCIHTIHPDQPLQTAAIRSSLSPPTPSSSSSPDLSKSHARQSSHVEFEELNSRVARIEKFKRILSVHNVDICELRKLAWSGVPEDLRSISWQLLLGYLPTNADRRVATLARKRKEYLDGVAQVFSTNMDQSVWHQIEIDVPRTNPNIKLYGFETTQKALERILYLWAIRHPASGYVQGINDLVTPFFQTFLAAYVVVDPEGYDPGQLPHEVLCAVEADTYWCLSKLLDGIQDNYIHAQPGIQRQVAQLRDLTQRIDGNLVKHLDGEGVHFIQFSFRWMNCLLMREVSVKNTIRMWDTYLAEGSQGFSSFHVYVCAAFLVKWSPELLDKDFQEIIIFLQALPTKEWTEKNIELLLSEAYMWQTLFKGATAHLR